MDNMIRVEHLCTAFGNKEILRDISFEISPGDIVAIIGASGSGKSTLLRSLNFLVDAQKGRISIGGLSVDVANAGKKEKLAIRRKTSMVFQNYHLFQNKTVLDNILLPMTAVQKLERQQALRRAEEILEIIKLPDKKASYPSQLSGGEQQRIGIGRALAVGAEVMLCDEPTSSLDPELVAGVLETISDLAKRKITMLIATHEMAFAKESAGQVFFLDQGQIIVRGTPEQVFEQSGNERVRNFLDKVIK